MEPQTSADQMNHTAVETRSMRPVGGWRGERDRLNQMPAPDTPLPRGSIAFPLRLTALVCGSFLIGSTAAAASGGPVISSVSPDEVIEKPVPQPTITIMGENLCQPGNCFSQIGNPTVTITHTELDGVSFSAAASTNFSGTQATLPKSNAFNLLQAPLGVYDLTLTRPDGASTTVAGAFSLITEPEPDPGTIFMRVASRWGGPVHGADVSPDGTLAAIANGRMLRILDLSDESDPTELGSIYLEAIQDVKMSGGYAFVAAAGSYGFAVVDISDPASPELVWTGGGGTQYDVELFGDYAYVRPQSGGLRVFDISDPLNVVSHGAIPDGSLVDSIAIEGDRLYLGGHAGSPRLRIFDLAADPASPPLLGAMPVMNNTDVYSVAVAKDYAYLAERATGPNYTLTVVNVANPTDPILVNAIDSFQGFPTECRIAAAGGRLYVPESRGGIGTPVAGMWILDIASDPVEPILITTYQQHAHLDAPTHAVLATRDDRIYLWDEAEGFIVVDVSDSANPQRLGKYHSVAKLGPMAKQGDVLYVSDRIGGFTILNVADPDSPQVVSNYVRRPPYENPYPWTGNIVFVQTQGIAVDGEHAYITVSSLGLEVINIADPSNPMFLNTYPVMEPTTPCAINSPCCSYFIGLAVRNGLAHIGYRYTDGSTCAGGALLTVDVSDPQNMTQISLPSGGLGSRIALGEPDTAFVVGSDIVVGDVERYFKNICTPSAEFVHSVGPIFSNDVAWHKNALYVTRSDCSSCEDGLYIRDVADPTAPALLTLINSGQAVAVDVQNDRAYVRWAGNPFHLYDVSDPASPVLLHNLNLSQTNNGTTTNAVLADEPNVYVTNGSNDPVPSMGLEVIHVHGIVLPKIGDLTDDGVVNVFDLLMLLAAWGDCADCNDCPADLDGSCAVNVFDMLELLANWG